MSKRKKRNAKNESLDDLLNFKPINDGLGFHQNKASSNPFNETPHQIKRTKKTSNATIQSNLQKDIRRPAFENSSNSPATEAAIEQYGTNVSVESALNIFHKVFSWVIDFSVISGTVLLASSAVFKYGFGIKGFQFLYTLDNWLYVIAPMFVYFYLFYFAMFWKTNKTTLGMNLFNLEIVSSSKNEISFQQTFLRSIMSLVSILSFGIIDILGLLDAFSWTQIKKA